MISIFSEIFTLFLHLNVKWNYSTSRDCFAFNTVDPLNNEVQGTIDPAFSFGDTDFARIVTTTTFVDKTLLIRKIVNNGILITAPRRFGKSTNLDMIKKFLEIQVDEEGNPKTKANFLNDAVKDTSNYDLFTKNKLKITQHVEIMREHFGRSPVIHADFNCEHEILNYKDAYNFCKNIIRKSFVEHRYLLNNKELKGKEKSELKMWYEEISYNDKFINSGLKNLSTYLYDHFKRRNVFVLIDNYDSIIINAMNAVKDEKELTHIIDLIISIMSCVLKSNTYISGGLITGITDIGHNNYTFVWLDDINNIRRYRFGENHEYVDFFGLTENDLGMLFGKNVTHIAYKTYHDSYRWEKSQIIYSFSVLNLLDCGVISNNFTDTSVMKNLGRLLKIPVIRNKAELLMDKFVTIQIQEKLKVEDIVVLRNLLEPLSLKHYNSRILFSLMLDHGYLTCMPYIDPSIKITPVKIPNDEIRGKFIQQFYER